MTLTPHIVWRLVTDLGDSSVVLPLGALLMVMLWRFESARAAWLLLRSLTLCVAALSLLKLVFISCGHALHTQLESPSGHTGLSILVYGALAAVAIGMTSASRTAEPADAALRPMPGGAALRLQALLTMLIGYAAPPLVAAIAVSRVALRAHTLPEVSVGAAVGLASLLYFVLPYRKLPHARFPMGAFLLLMLGLLVLTYGANSPAENLIRYFASFIVRGGGVCSG